MAVFVFDLDTDLETPSYETRYEAFLGLTPSYETFFICDHDINLETPSCETRVVVLFELDIDIDFEAPSYRHRFHEVRALRALMHAARTLRENGDDMRHMVFFDNDIVLETPSYETWYVAFFVFDLDINFETPSYETRYEAFFIFDHKP